MTNSVVARSAVNITVFPPQPLPYWEEALRSVLHQVTGADQMQIEVIDDASPNGAPTEFIRKLSGERVAVHCEQRNLGLAGIWNHCIERARTTEFTSSTRTILYSRAFYRSLRSGVEKFPQTGAALCHHAYCDETGHWHPAGKG